MVDPWGGNSRPRRMISIDVPSLRWGEELLGIFRRSSECYEVESGELDWSTDWTICQAVEKVRNNLSDFSKFDTVHTNYVAGSPWLLRQEKVPSKFSIFLENLIRDNVSEYAWIRMHSKRGAIPYNQFRVARVRDHELFNVLENKYCLNLTITYAKK